MIGPWDAVQIVDAAIAHMEERKFIYPTAKAAMLKACIRIANVPFEDQVKTLTEVLDRHSRTWDNDDPCDEVRV